MSNLCDKVIVTDCDGCLTDWVYMFDQWMLRHGYRKIRSDKYAIDKCYGISKEEAFKLVKFFNESAAIEYLPAFRDAMKYVRKLHVDHGYLFHCITSLTTEPFAVRAREKNLNVLFGETVFEKIVCLETGATKEEALLPYVGSGCIFIEDRVDNAKCAQEMGLTSILMSHDHNLEHVTTDIPIVNNWKEIYEMIV